MVFNRVDAARTQEMIEETNQIYLDYVVVTSSDISAPSPTNITKGASAP